MQPAPAGRAYSTAFTALDASQTGQAALDRLQKPDGRRARHVIVRREHSGLVYFYLFESAEVLGRLGACSQQERARSTLTILLDLHASTSSPTVDEQEAPFQGAVVVRGDRALGFVAPDSPEPPTPASPPMSLPDVLGGLGGLGGLGKLGRLFRHRSSRDAARSLPDLDVFGEVFNSREAPSRQLPDEETVEFSVRAEPTPDLLPEPTGAALPDDAPPLPPPAPPRFFNARTPDRVALNAQTYVIVQVAGEAAQPAPGTAAANAPIGGFTGELTIDVHAPGLKAIGPTTLTLQVPASGNSASLRFGFMAQQPGIQQVDVMAWNGSAQVAGVTLQIAVATEAVTAGANEAVGDMDMREPESGEYTLDVAMDAETRRYRFQLRSDRKDVWPPMYSEPLLNARQQNYDATIANLNAQARNLYALKKEDQAVWLRGMGNLLFEQLVPDGLKALLIEHKRNIRVLNILSEADPTPWELLFLADPDTGEGDFLAASTTVARWRYGAGPCRSLKRATKVLVLPADAPPQAQAELQRLQTLLNGASTIGDLTSLNTLLAAGGFDLLHFAAHNVNLPNVQGGAYVPFGQQRWDLTFMGAVPQNKFKSRAPLVFMNACTTSGTTALYTELASWADRFLKCGSGAFIGTLWEVRDVSARQFSETFYDELIKGQTLGEAMQAARAKLRAANPGDPTPLAYTLYGNPLARLEHA
ncbi:hypothetical protein RD110_20225 [Rhodoferax koreense]|uniref:Uncharacterized protein n=2 Tax=Rhodoferax koreensis TaxID=1842727 RepID=A0A1P8JZT1_9BURK|nr:hypothetical protein RD110_20225 [Rhodoferax koreense]